MFYHRSMEKNNFDCGQRTAALLSHFHFLLCFPAVVAVFCAAAGLAQGFDPGLRRAAIHDDPIHNTVRHSDTLPHSFVSAGFRHSAGFGVSAT